MFAFDLWNLFAFFVFARLSFIYFLCSGQNYRELILLRSMCVVIAFSVACVIDSTVSLARSLSFHIHCTDDDTKTRQKKKIQSFTKSVCRFQLYIYRSAERHWHKCDIMSVIFVRSFQDVFSNRFNLLPRMRSETEKYADEKQWTQMHLIVTAGIKLNV